MPDFILRLREKVGHDLLWLPGVTAVVLDGEQVLLQRRADTFQWSPIGGIVEPGEHPAVTAEREVLEETGVACRVESLVWVTVTEPVEYANGDRAQYVDHVFRCRYLDGEARVTDDESLRVGWFSTRRLPDMASGLADRILAAVHDTGAVRLH